MKRIAIFLALTFVVTWAMAFALMAAGGLQNPYATLVFMGFMLVPALMSLLTRVITKQGFKDMWLKPNIRRSWPVWLIAWFAPTVLTVMGAVVYFLLYPAQFDSTMSGVIGVALDQYRAAGQAAMPVETIRTLLFVQLAVGVFLSPVLNIIFTTGEELGWRGYLLPGLMKRFSPRIATLLTGIIWGLWHAPMIAMGHNYGVGYPGAPWLGIVAMIGFCVFTGALFSWVTLRSGTMLTASVAHGALNGMAAAASYFLVAGQGNPFIGPLPIGVIGGIGFIIAGALCFLWLGKYEPEPAEAEAVPLEATGTEDTL